MSNSLIVKPDGNPVEMVPVIKWRGLTLPCRVVNPEVFKETDPRVSIAAVKVEVGDQNNLLWAGLWALAMDIYTRQPGGSTEFIEFMDSMGLVLTDGHGNKVDVHAELAKILKKN